MLTLHSLLARSLVAAFFVVLFFTPGQLAAQDSAVDENQVVARVDGEDILLVDVLKLASNLPPQYQAQFAQIYPLLVRRVVDFRLAGKAGRAEGLGDDAEVKARIAEAEDRAIREVYLERKIESRVTDDAVRQEYAKYLEENPPVTEQRASHILLETEEKAREIIAKLGEGADFAELAKEISTGPSAPKGGDLGYFTAEQMVPEFSAVAEKLQPGEYSKEPTQTQFGWHVIRVEDRREVAQPGFAEMEGQLRDEMAREAVETILADLRDGANVEILPAGETAPAAPEAAQ
jgi:peptidyl-prolyl cis-trans isomerase C